MVSVAARTGDRSALLPAAAVLFGLATLAVAAATGRGVAAAALVLALVSGFAVASRALTRWPTVVGAIVLIILFIPIARYKIAAGLPFDLEPYRVVVALVVCLWIASL